MTYYSELKALQLWPNPILNAHLGLFQQQRGAWRQNPIGAYQQMPHDVTRLPPLPPIRLLDDDGQPLRRRYERWVLCMPRRVTLPRPILTRYAREIGAATLTYQELTGARRVRPHWVEHRSYWSGPNWRVYLDTWASRVNQARFALWIREAIPPLEYKIWMPPLPDKPSRVSE